MSQLENNASGLPPSSNLPVDSISLGQMKNFIGANQRPKQSWFDFQYDDEDTVMNELEEFYSYIEMPQTLENYKAWEGCFPSEWTKAPLQQRRSHVELLLESLEHRDAEIRFINARRLFYVVQGTYAETVSPEHQLHWIFENCKVVRSANGIPNIVEALKIAGRKHDLLSNLSDQDAAHYYISVQEKSDIMEEVVTEISVYLGMLYHLIEVFKGHDDFADELMSLDPPLPVYLFNTVAGLRDKSAKGYPIKKLLLVLWKTLLACWGGMKDHERAKKIARELAGLPPHDGKDKIKTTPIDIEIFRQEMTVKYPTFTPPAQPPPSLVHAPIAKVANPAQLTRRLSEAYSPIPIRHHYHHDEPEPPMSISQQNSQNFGQQTFMRGYPQPPTPVPSPPPGPKPKKQLYQTDQNRPFLFPFSKSTFRGDDPKLVPFAIDEADRLYNRHMYVSLALAQMWKTREDCMSSESGLDKMPGTEGEERSSTYNPDEAETGEPLPDVKLLEEKIEEANLAVKNAETTGEKRKALERREDLLRLLRVEQIYSAVLPVFSPWVLVLLKLLLATVSPNATNLPVPQPSTSYSPDGVSLAPEQIQSPPTLDEIDVVRHREITSKAVSAILLLVLKWFKASHVMKFHHLGGSLLDTNCLLLILKMFGLQEVTQTVVSKADSPDNNFFRYCLLHVSKNPQLSRPEDDMNNRPPRQVVTRTVTLPNGEKHEEEVEQITDYSWRNFFSTINFAKIMQKLSKGRAHRIFMLVTYKSSAVLKRVLRVPHPLLQLHILKLIKSQVPFCGKKWRQTNMKVITAIYHNCRPDLRDEWLTGSEPEEPGEAQVQEQALRQLVKFYNTKRYGPLASQAPQGPHHRRQGSMSHYLEGLQPDPQLTSLIRPVGTPNTVDSDVFPPSRSQAPNPSIFLPYTTEDLAFEEEYEEYLSDLGLGDDYQGHGSSTDAPGASSSGTSAWHRLPEYVTEMTDNISDSESIVSIGDLGDANQNKDDGDVLDENLNNWEHMSPKTMAALPKSPATGRRRSSSGGGLRPVIPFGLDDGTAVDDDEEEEAPREHTGPSVDEVEYAYGV